MTALATAQRRDQNDQLHQVQAPDDVRWRALARLYERRSAVDNLIGALERYQREQSPLTVKCAAVSAVEMSS
jgi:hypothetical protein